MSSDNRATKKPSLLKGKTLEEIHEAAERWFALTETGRSRVVIPIQYDERQQNKYGAQLDEFHHLGYELWSTVKPASNGTEEIEITAAKSKLTEMTDKVRKLHYPAPPLVDYKPVYEALFKDMHERRMRCNTSEPVGSAIYHLLQTLMVKFGHLRDKGPMLQRIGTKPTSP